MLGILAQIQGGDYAKRNHHNTHDDDHHDRPENSGEHTALGIGLARVFPKEFPEARHVQAEAFKPVHIVGQKAAHNTGDGQLFFLAVNVLHSDVIARVFPV